MAERDHGGAEVLELSSVPGFVVFDLPGAPESAGGTDLILEALPHPSGPLAGACERAGRFLRGWWGEPPGPAYAPEG